MKSIILTGRRKLETAQRIFAAEEWVQSQDWTGKEEPCAVQVALERLRREQRD